MNTVYNVDYFIKKFEAIPENLWICDEWGKDDKHCAGGHCGVDKGNVGITDMFKALDNILNGLKITPVWKDFFTAYAATQINDKETKEYQQPTPKQRILAALYDIKKMQYPELSETTVNDLIGEKELNERNPYS